MNKTHYRQGDVLIERVENIPTNAVKQSKSKNIVLAHGEMTGHHHRLEVRRAEKYGKWHDPVDWWKQGEISSANQRPTDLAGELYVTLPAGGVVTHPEHSRIQLPSGTYRVSRQREYSPEVIRNVKD